MHYKRLLEIFLSIFLIIFLSPLFAIVTILILFLDKHHPFFIQKRVGKNSKIFKLIKFQTMAKSKSKSFSGNTFEEINRITPLGSFLRKTKIDEIPQLINIFKGEMSFVGPRPDLIFIYEDNPDLDYKYLSLKPGLLSPASIFFAKEVKLMKSNNLDKYFYNEHIWKIKVFLNNLYYEEQNIIFDCLIIIFYLLPIFFKKSFKNKFPWIIAAENQRDIFNLREFLID